MTKNHYTLLINIIFLVIIFFIFHYYFNNNRNDILKNTVIKANNLSSFTKIINYSSFINELKKKYNNSDVVGYLEILETNNKETIFQTNDNNYYLNHTSEKKESYIGEIFLDYRLDINKSKKLLIYGHSSKYQILPFNFLQNFYDEEYYKKHKYIELITSTSKRLYEIFSVYVETKDFSYMEIDFPNEDEYLSHIKKLQNKSIFSTGVTLSKEDEILILQTCSTHSDYKDYENKYLLIIARRISKYEKNTK